MRSLYDIIRRLIVYHWRMFWLKHSGPRGFGRIAAWLASRHTGPYHSRSHLADISERGFVAPSAILPHSGFHLGNHTYLGDRVIIYHTNEGGPIEIQNGVHLYGDAFIETGKSGRIYIDEGTHIQPGCHIHAFITDIRIGKQVEIASNCAFYNYDHGMDSDRPMMTQPLASKGGIIVGDGAWIGHGVTVLQGVSIGKGAVIAAGAVVTHDVPDNAIAAGVPARVVRSRPTNRPEASMSHSNRNPGLRSAPVKITD